MRQSLQNAKAHYLKYEIREIVDTVHKLQSLDPTLQVEFENIGDPVAKGWPVPPFLKKLIKEEMDSGSDAAFAYTHSRGNIETRKWVADYARRYSPNTPLQYEDILFVNGLGAGIGILYSMIPAGRRILQPSPTYPTHASLEAFNAGQDPIMYDLDPENDWQPNFEDMETQLKAHPEIVGILLINPNNPTGAVYSAETLEKVVALAEKYDCFLISDEIYFRMVYGDTKYVQITEVAMNRVPLIVMRGLSKDVPWPGSRCGWLEFHNENLDPEFQTFANDLKRRILLEVCSTSLPQILLPRIYDHPEFQAWQDEYSKGLSEAIESITARLSQVKGLKVNAAKGAFYMVPTFEPGVLNERQSLPISNPEVKATIEALVSQPNFPLDKRFAYYLVASAGICVVPASSFYSRHHGFRVTTLIKDSQKRAEVYDRLATAIEAYLASA